MNLFKRLFKRNKKEEEQKELETMMENANDEGLETLQKMAFSVCLDKEIERVENANDEGLKTLQKMAFSICLDKEIERVENGETDNLNNLIPFFKRKEVEEEVEEEKEKETSHRKLTDEEVNDLIRRINARVKEIEEEEAISSQTEYSESKGRTR